MTKSNKEKFDKYEYYESSVQSPDEQAVLFEGMFKELRGRDPVSLKEDFCGTFLISCEWVKLHPSRTALGVDLDPETIAYGKSHGYKKLTASEKKRITHSVQDVCKPTVQKVDVIAACNFSFFIFKEREQMKKYFSAALKSLHKEGILVLEMAGGPGFIATVKEQRTYTVKGIGKYTYYWHQKSFDPVNNHGIYAIHFRTPKKELKKDVFVYDWRVWSIPELREILIECGYSDVAVYWEQADKQGDGTGEYLRSKTGDNAHSWIAFVVGIK
jgi:hypothetical protein